jgi:hypothetical protein
LYGAPKNHDHYGLSVFVWINANEIISSWYLLGAVCVAPPTWNCSSVKVGETGQLPPWPPLPPPPPALPEQAAPYSLMSHWTLLM